METQLKQDRGGIGADQNEKKKVVKAREERRAQHTLSKVIVLTWQGCCLYLHTFLVCRKVAQEAVKGRVYNGIRGQPMKDNQHSDVHSRSCDFSTLRTTEFELSLFLHPMLACMQN